MTAMMKILYKKLYDIGKLMKIKDDYYLLIGINEEYKPDTIRIESVDSIAIKYIDVLDEELIFIINSNSSLKNTVYSFRLLKEMINSDFDSIFDNIFINGVGLVDSTPDTRLYIGLQTIERIRKSLDSYYNNMIFEGPDKIAKFTNIQDNQNFNILLSMKSADGTFPYIRSEEHIITLFNGLLPILKNDKIDLSVYDFCGYFFTVDFEIVKKRVSVHVIMNCLY